MKNRLGWIEGNWGLLEELHLPINDRGLNFGDGIFETILIFNGKPQFFAQHLNRWKNSAIQLGMALPPKKEKIINLIHSGIELCSIQKGFGAIRLNWSRGANPNRGININEDIMQHRFWLEINSIQPSFNPLTAIISHTEKRNANSKLNAHKTFAYGQSIQARREANTSGYDEALLESTTGEICCGTTANLIVKRNDTYLTPRLKSGCLPGIMRQQGINLGLFKEANIDITPQIEDEWLLINSLNCQPISKINNNNLKTSINPTTLWLSLYGLCP